MKQILNKFLLIIALLGIFDLSAQKKDGSEPSYKKFRQEYKYLKDKKYPGPERSFSVPVPMENQVYDDGERAYEGLEYSKDRIQQSRKGTKGRGGSTGTKPYDPDIERMPFPDSDQPDVNIPPPSASGPSISPTFWKVLLIIIGFLLLAWAVYMVVKNYKPKNQPAVGNFSPSDWNPELIPKTELELRLEDAMLRNDYRECVRIYFTFILKELIRLRKIKWKKDLTNIDYILQLSGKDGYVDFLESVRIYDLVWYGEYEITQKEYEQVLPHLAKHYQSLSAQNE